MDFLRKVSPRFFGAESANFLWLAGDRGLRLIVAIGVSGWSARYLGAENFGLLNYSAALVAIFIAVASGMEALVLRGIIRDESRAGLWLGTAMVFRFFVTAACSVICLGAVLLLRGWDKLVLELVVIFAAGASVQALEWAELLFQARIQMRRLVVPRLALFFAINALKVGLIFLGMSVVWFAVMTSLELFVGGLITYWMAKRELGAENRYGCDFALGWELIRDSWPLSLSWLSVEIHAKIGIVIVGGMLGEWSAGIFAAAIRAPDALKFLPRILGNSLLPRLLRSNDGVSAAAEEQATLQYFRISVLMGLAIAVPLCVGAGPVIHVLCGANFAASAPVMAVYSWMLVFLFLGHARDQVLLNRRQTQTPFIFSLTALAINVAGSMMLVPVLGLMGVAWAVLLSQMAAGFFASFAVPAARRLGVLELRALLTPWQALHRTPLTQTAAVADTDLAIPLDRPEA